MAADLTRAAENWSNITMASPAIRPISQFAAHEITTDGFKESLHRTIETLYRAIQTQVRNTFIRTIFGQTIIVGEQAAEVKNLKSEIERLKKPDECPVSGREKDWKDFQWLLEASDDDDEEPDNARGKRNVRQRDSKRSAESDEDSENDGESDLNSIEGQVET
jgi:hypothetical protein